MRQVLADLAIEVEAATWLSIGPLPPSIVVGAAPGADAEHEAALRQIAYPPSKYFVCKRTAFTVAEAMECLGGPGYVEETGLPVSSRGTAQFDLGGLRKRQRTRLAACTGQGTSKPQCLACSARSENDARFSTAVTGVLDQLARDPFQLEAQARLLAERMALLLQGSILTQNAPNEVADAFVATRLGPGGAPPRTFGAYDT